MPNEKNPHRRQPDEIAPTLDHEPLEEPSRLVEILDGYLAELKAGKRPDRAKLLADNPELAEQLEGCLAGIDFIHAADSGEAGPPKTLGDFRILREVGRGGMGAVYEAEQVSLGRRVALKVLRLAAVSDPQAIGRFQREAETVAQLHHTNIVPIFSVGSAQGVNYYAMQFIEGQSLDALLADEGGPLAPAQVAQWGLEAAEALDHAHSRGVIHRDVKSSNLILDGEGRIWLTDFGLAKRASDVRLSMTGAILGTPRYMSPEQASAKARSIDHRTDLYSLGATLYELATGRPVFSSETPHGVISQILAEDPPPPRSHRPDLPRDLDTILVKCLAKEPSQRYASARELADDLRAFLDGRSIKARRTSPVELAARWVKRQQQSVKLTLAAVAATLVLVLGGLFAWYSWTQAQLAELSLDTDSPPLVAEFLDEEGEPVVEPETVPTQQPVELRSGDVRVRLIGSGRLSQTYEMSLAPGERSAQKLNLGGDRAASWQVERAFRLVEFDDGADVFLLGDQTIERHDGGGEKLWSVELPDNFEDSPGFYWDWLLSWSYAYGKLDLTPFVTAASRDGGTGDLNSDGHADLLSPPGTRRG